MLNNKFWGSPHWSSHLSFLRPPKCCDYKPCVLELDTLYTLASSQSDTLFRKGSKIVMGLFIHSFIWLFETVSLCIPVCPGIHSVDWAGLELCLSLQRYAHYCLAWVLFLSTKHGFFSEFCTVVSQIRFIRQLILSL